MAKQLRQSELGSSVNHPIDISDDDSEVKRKPNLKTSLPSSAGKKANQVQKKGAIRAEPSITKIPTPDRPLPTVSPSSNASSSTTIDSIFDLDSETPGTPLTPPLDYRDPARKQLFNKLPNRSRPLPMNGFEDLPSSGASGNGRARTPCAEVEDLTSGVHAMSINDGTNPNDGTSPKDGISFNDGINLNDVSDQSEEDISDSGPESPISKDKSKRTTKVPAQSNRRESRSTDRKIPVIQISNSESENSYEDESDYSMEESRTLREEQSQRKATHKRSSSAPSNQYTADIEDAETDSESAHAGEDSSTRIISPPASIPKSRKQGSGGASTLSVTPRKTRSRSTGSIAEEKTSIQTPPKGPNGGRATTSASKPRRASSTAAVNATGNPQESSAVEEDRTPIFEPHQEAAKSPTEAKTNLLDLVQKEYKRKSVWKQLHVIWESIKGSKKSSVALPDIDGGFVYMFKIKEFEKSAPGHFKIGQTKNRVSQRMTAWRYKCGVKPVQLGDENENRFLHFGRIEKIVHAELSQKRRKFKCFCGITHEMQLRKEGGGVTTHNEWFEVEEEVGLKTISKWRDWVVQMQPYHSDGTLRACWLWKCEKARGKKGTDWDKFREFGWLETIECCLAQLSKVFGNFWRVKVFRPGFHIFLSCVVLAYLTAGFSRSSCYTFLFLICLYLVSWFNYS